MLINVGKTQIQIRFLELLSSSKNTTCSVSRNNGCPSRTISL